METSLFHAYTEATSIEHRRKFGQFFTGPVVARFMINWLLENKKSSIMDPAFGLGAFAEEALANPKLESFRGFEIDPHVLSFSKKQFKDVSLKQADYLLNWKNPEVDAIVCNPPYMKFQNFADKEEVLQSFVEHLGVKLSGYMNTASAFLLKSISEVSEGSRIAYIMPFEFMNAGYGELVKDHLLKFGEVNAFIKLACEKEAFSEVTTSVGIILFTKKNKPKSDIPFYVVHSLSELTTLKALKPLKTIKRTDLKAADKWAIHFEEGEIIFQAEYLTELKTFGNFSRGIATGANEYFGFSKSKATDHKIPEDNLIPCISKSQQIKSSLFEKNDLNALVKSDATIYLVDLMVDSDAKAVKSYIKSGVEQEIHTRYLTKMRNPWYKLEKRAPAKILFGVFSRGGYKVIRNFTKAINLTCYHGFYPNTLGEKYVDYLFFYFMSDAAGKIMQANMRKYGDGLDKFEPNDLNRSLVPNIQWFDSLTGIDTDEEYAFIRKQDKLSPRLEALFANLL